MSQEKIQNKELQKLKQSISNKSFAEEVVQQIEKDLVRSGVFDEGCMQKSSLELKGMVCHLGQLISEMIQNNIDSFPTYLYLVDIPESRLKHEFLDITKVDQTAEIILIREAQKVYLRRKFSSQK